MTDVQIFLSPYKRDTSHLYDKTGNMVLGRSARRRSCEMVNTTLPCVNKALYHIQQLEGNIKRLLVQNEDISQKDSVPRVSNVNVENQISDTKMESPNLHIKGTGLIDAGLILPDAAFKRDTKAIISEVVELIWRLETDRQEAEEAVKLEKARKQALIAKVDGLSLWKLCQLPEAVQREYESVTQDISELQWHITCKKQDLERALSKACKTETENAKIQEEIDFIKKHSPLLEEKLNHECDVMAKIKQAQEEASALLTEAELTCKASELKFEEGVAAANQERMIMATQLGQMKTTLQSCKDNLCRAQTVFAEDNALILNIEKQIIDGKKLCTELQNEKRQAKETEDSWNRQVNDMKYELDDQEMKMKNLTIEYSTLLKETEITKYDFESQLSHLENHFHNKLHELRDLEYNNKSMSLENEDHIAKISKCSKAKVKHVADIHRMQKNIIENEAETLKVTKELPQMYSKHAATKTKLDELKEQSRKEESLMKNLSDNLRKQITDEARTSQLTQVRIHAIANEMQQKEKEHKKTKDELAQVVEEIEKPVRVLEKKVKKLKLEHNKKSQVLKSMQEIKENCDEKFKVTSLQLGQRKNTLKQQLSDAQEQFSQVSAQLKHTAERTDQFLKDIRDLEQYGIIIGNGIKSTENAITVLQDDYNMLKLKLKDINDIDRNLQNEIDKCTDRRQIEIDDYQTQMRNRQKLEGKSRKVMWGTCIRCGMLPTPGRVKRAIPHLGPSFTAVCPLFPIPFGFVEVIRVSASLDNPSFYEDARTHYAHKSLLDGSVLYIMQT
ncbi:Hypothetical predicted protein [Pelobates cultripes]|uniref:Coiled-coil domain-containing protein 178 n=1 Tax=Pelobates cultripes TaxID=61616 RepID=A0AAD1S2K8_PELCU|nr:Hypothetical predicted protein [Pelobates cultripes]